MSDGNGVSLSQKELSLLVSAFSTSNTDLKPDYDAMAEQMGYSNAKCAATMWSNLRRKVLGPAGSRPSATSSSPKKVGSGASPKKASDGSAKNGSPRKAGNKKKTTVSRYIDPSEDDDDDATPFEADDDEEESKGMVKTEEHGMVHVLDLEEA